MAELLIKATDATNPDPVKDLRGCYKKGDVVVVKPDGWSWGKEELNKDKFYILRVPDKKPEDLAFLEKLHEIQVGTRYIAEAPELGIHVEGTDATSALNEAQKRCEAVTTEMKKFGITPSYSIEQRTEPMMQPIARRRIKVDITGIETSLKSGTVELTSDKVLVEEKATGTSSTLATLSTLKAG